MVRLVVLRACAVAFVCVCVVALSCGGGSGVPSVDAGKQLELEDLGGGGGGGGGTGGTGGNGDDPDMGGEDPIDQGDPPVTTTPTTTTATSKTFSIAAAASATWVKDYDGYITDNFFRVGLYDRHRGLLAFDNEDLRGPLSECRDTGRLASATLHVFASSTNKNANHRPLHVVADGLRQPFLSGNEHWPTNFVNDGAYVHELPTASVIIEEGDIDSDEGESVSFQWDVTRIVERWLDTSADDDASQVRAFVLYDTAEDNSGSTSNSAVAFSTAPAILSFQCTRTPPQQSMVTRTRIDQWWVASHPTGSWGSDSLKVCTRSSCDVGYDNVLLGVDYARRGVLVWSADDTDQLLDATATCPGTVTARLTMTSKEDPTTADSSFRLRALKKIPQCKDLTRSCEKASQSWDDDFVDEYTFGETATAGGGGESRILQWDATQVWSEYVQERDNSDPTQGPMAVVVWIDGDVSSGASHIGLFSFRNNDDDILTAAEERCARGFSLQLTMTIAGAISNAGKDVKLKLRALRQAPECSDSGASDDDSSEENGREYMCTADALEANFARRYSERVYEKAVDEEVGRVLQGNTLVLDVTEVWSQLSSKDTHEGGSEGGHGAFALVLWVDGDTSTNRDRGSLTFKSASSFKEPTLSIRRGSIVVTVTLADTSSVATVRRAVSNGEVVVDVGGGKVAAEPAAVNGGDSGGGDGGGGVSTTTATTTGKKGGVDASSSSSSSSALSTPVIVGIAVGAVVCCTVVIVLVVRRSRPRRTHTTPALDDVGAASTLAMYANPMYEAPPRSTSADQAMPPTPSSASTLSSTPGGGVVASEPAGAVYDVPQVRGAHVVSGWEATAPTYANTVSANASPQYDHLRQPQGQHRRQQQQHRQEHGQAAWAPAFGHSQAHHAAPPPLTSTAAPGVYDMLQRPEQEPQYKSAPDGEYDSLQRLTFVRGKSVRTHKRMPAGNRGPTSARAHMAVAEEDAEGDYVDATIGWDA
ncbi:hypothetical protein PTSG_01812 [Salpingoeca rosetta]|uniref:Uncharacterized protein n=1 Tax=Salpingoeca rosetta (strain ATCC 50818 / BSB-021) TaxID=946362 RepID=F2TZ12_SALR5|nr:uncharacterized protein PTSG_01812 [Salpingoeca rosetta]EGD78836.1 hypothetical protein PTSG_01812 [Salpingoeca rosetta]|eukprot:XP_004997792.1 hypothetical protein PTSG_01812 [Salpingoeca rosetta]